MKRSRVLLLPIALLFLSGCATGVTRKMEVTAYCNCGKCCGWERGSWKYLKLDQWNRYVSEGNRKGKRYDGNTASGEKPKTARKGLVSVDTLTHPWKAPLRALTAPTSLFTRKGTIAADTDFYPMGTRLYIPGYGWGVVEDRGGAIKGPDRLDLYMGSHRKALRWGRQKVDVEIIPLD